jgi:hypothetical protein
MTLVFIFCLESNMRIYSSRGLAASRWIGKSEAGRVDKGSAADHRYPMRLRRKLVTAGHVLRTDGIRGVMWRITRGGRRLWLVMGTMANKGVCSIEIKTEYGGFFGQMTWCLFILQYCEQRGLIPDIRLTGENYLDHARGQNWLHFYFDLSEAMSSEEIARRARYTNKSGVYGPPIVQRRMNLEDGARILHKYLHIKPHINEMVEDFWMTLRVDGPVVGIHFRGTDKSTEAPRVSWQHCLNVLRDYLHDNANVKAVFVASDEHRFVDFIKQNVKTLPVYSHNDHYRSIDGRPLHREREIEGGYEKGEDALVNALLLSKCSTLIRTASLLSAWASIFNPELNVILLNKPYDPYLWYPESEILKGCHIQYLPEPN